MRLTATVSNVGGLGSFGANDLAPEDVFNTVVQIRKQIDKPFAVNLWVSTFHDGVDVLPLMQVTHGCSKSCHATTVN